MKLTVILVLVASALVFKACDSGATKDERSKNMGRENGDDEDAETGAAPSETGSDVPDEKAKSVYTLKINLESYADSDITALRFYLAEKSQVNQTFLKEIEISSDFDFSDPKVTLSSADLESIDDYTNAEACITVKAVRTGIESDESLPYCITKW